MSGYSCDMGQWSGFFQDARKRVGDLTPAHAAIGELLQPEVKANILRGEGFAPLAPSTRTQERLRYGTQPLLKTRKLLNEITYRAEKAYCDVGSALLKARSLFFGYAPRNLPARNPFRFRADVLDKIGDIYVAFIMGLN